MAKTGVSPPRDLGIPNPFESLSLFVPTGRPRLARAMGPTLKTMAGVELERTHEQWALHPTLPGLFPAFLGLDCGALEQHWERRGDQEPEPPCRAWADAVPSPGTRRGPLPQLLS